MTTNEHPGSTQHQTPADIRDVTFQRRMLGLETDRVYEYLDLLADQVQAAQREHGELRSENERLRAELESKQAQLDEYEHMGDRVNDQVVQLFSQAQLIAEEMVEDVSRDARERIGQARAHERQIVEEAVHTAGQHVRSYAEAAQLQMQSIMDTFASEVHRLGDVPAPRDAQTTPPRPRDPLFDDLSTWQVNYRNGSGNGNGQHSSGPA